MTFTGFTSRAFTFLRGLAKHNEKPWFEAHRDSYENDLRAPMIALVDEMDARFGEFAPEMVGDRRRSVFRIHRDVRFSKDKRPYKTNAACWFFHRDVSRARQGERAGESSAAVHGGAGLYFQLAPADCWVGGGLWMPPRPALNMIREALAADHRGFERIVRAPAFAERFGALDAESLLTRTPRGYDADHPAAEWLRYQSFTAGRKMRDAETLGASLPETLEADYRLLLPLVRWLNAALHLQAARRR
ncbi:Conserved hypothetical protein CHP02453 [Gemmatirosa kalamazoonensis]|uniref:TIGR02453 family protein n=1 Tax=Gemmatirosa kalamazoonensis TaxID=861299 RepID=W0RK13_9BACT|nr:DUF2461 domain-containing protein [Gemmatirosa kalamazoonensis]AHG91439.1 Conserved hypothetical protein CHP02453 [Gemmatirosa kalamazoonensis]